ncbi:MAG: PH domain-containing protein [Pirellulaceae bacterium]|jgi:putative membrane protein|nr:PH domain-containing protein [Pirellulaceae bacterium]
MANETIILRAEFSEKVKTYWLMSTVVACVMSILGILALPILIPIIMVVGDRRLRAMECNLTDRSLQVKRGVWFRFEKTIPLDKITDLALAQGPVMRHLGLQALSVETAGSSQPGALVSLVGIVDAEAFRDAVLKQKEVHAETAAGVRPALTEAADH